MSAKTEVVAYGRQSGALRYAGIGLLWTMSVLLALVFLAAGWAKFDSFWVSKFVGYGYPSWFTYVVGATELVGGTALMIPRIAAFGAALLGMVMLGATATHLLHDESNWSFTVIILLILAGIAVARQKIAQSEVF